MYAQTTCFSPTMLLYILHLFSIAYKYIYMNWKERLYTNWVPLKQTENWYTMPLRTYSTHVWWDKSGKCWWGHLHNTVRFSDHSNHKLKISQRQNKAQRTLIANLFLLHQLLNGLPSLSLYMDIHILFFNKKHNYWNICINSSKAKQFVSNFFIKSDFSIH